MRALVLSGPGGVDALDLREVPEPDPAPGEVRIRVETVSINRLDLLLMGGAAPAGARYPIVPGLDPVGVVDVVGRDVDAGLLGRRVVVKPNLSCGDCASCRGAEDDECRLGRIVGVHLDGGWAEALVVPVRAVHPVPDGAGSAEVSAAIHSVPVALRLIDRCGGTGDGRVALVTGAAGAVGDALVQLAREAGTHVVAIVSDARKAEHVRSRGVADVLVLGPDAGEDAVRELGADLGSLVGEGLDLLLDPVADTRLWPVIMPLLAPGARIGVCGTLAARRFDLDLTWLYRNRSSIHGSAGARRSDVDRCLDLLARRRVAAAVDGVLPFTAVAAALERSVRRDRIGKVVLRPG